MRESLLVAILLAASVASCSVIRRGTRHENVTKEKDSRGFEHRKEESHNINFSFFAEDDAKTLDEMKPDESRQRLRNIVVEKIDQNRDGFVTEEELVKWIKYIQRRFLTLDTQTQWDTHNIVDDKLKWQAYKDKVFGASADKDAVNNSAIRDNMKKDHRRFVMADQDRSDDLSFEEFIDFLHPDDAPHMRKTIMLETMEDVDKNKDGFIDEAEYVSDMWQGDKDNEPDWVKLERDSYRKWRDWNKDGRMDTDEVQRWISPLDYDYARAETQHLIHQSDLDKDGKLTVVEILNKYDMFVGSEATDYGDALLRRHDEF